MENKLCLIKNCLLKLKYQIKAGEKVNKVVSCKKTKKFKEAFRRI